jgi:glutathione peroxidase
LTSVVLGTTNALVHRTLSAKFACELLSFAIALGVAACNHGANTNASEPARPEANMNVYSVPVKTLEGETTNLDRYAGKVTLMVNVASYCGNTPQYSGLEALHQKYQAKGFSVLGFPSNDFGQQEPGTAGEIREFCSTKYKVTFPLFEKLRTKKGEDQSPLYAKLGEASGKLPTWNFAKYLVGRDGRVIQYFDAKTQPEDPKLVAAIDAAVAEPPK